ncbi:MAG: 30S ribosomal protein S5 [Patescibacteria group bacterium]|nr:30S ribosomal protein S5 [Patescibacteria group bacterium]
MTKSKEKKQDKSRVKEEKEFNQQVVDIRRVTRVTKGGKRLRFRACVVIGDKKGRVGYGMAKGADVAMAVNKAVVKAEKDILNVIIINDTISHEIRIKYKSARLMLKPAKQGKGIIAGGAIRTVLELAGYKNVTGKMFGSRNKVNNVRATFQALKSFKYAK